MTSLRVVQVFLSLAIGVSSVANASEPFADHEVQRVIDGDTADLAGIGRVRFIGVDTPETVHPNKPVEWYGKEASAFTKKMIEGKRVRVEYDWQKKDKYGRTLVYIYLADGTFLNAEIIKQGFGFAYTRFPFKFLDEFRAYEREAREARRGLWGPRDEASGVVPASAPMIAPAAVPAVAPVGSGFSCSPRKTCGQMSSCEEARFQLSSCGNRRLDGDGDGVPCEKLCR
jgi:micrococcal nuclease